MNSVIFQSCTFTSEKEVISIRKTSNQELKEKTIDWEVVEVNKSVLLLRSKVDSDRLTHPSLLKTELNKGESAFILIQKKQDLSKPVCEDYEKNIFDNIDIWSIATSV